MINPREGDSQIVEHARRELQMAKLFDANEKENYDGFIGRGALSMVKNFDKWTDNDPAKMSALSEVFSFLIHKELLSAPTNDPDEWEEFNIEGSTGLKNKRNEFYISRDNLKTWYNLRSGQQGVIHDYKTGKPLEGVTINEKSTTNASDTGDGGHSDGPGNGSGDSDAVPTGHKQSEGSEKMEDQKLHDRVEPESQENQTSSETETPEPKGREE